MNNKISGISSLVFLALILSGCMAMSNKTEESAETTTTTYFLSEAKLPPPPIPLPPAPVVKQVIVQGIVYFDFDKHNIKPEFNRVIEQHARVLRDNPSTVVRVEGHTDILGSEAYNKPLALLRANEVRTALINLGVQPQQMDPVGYSFHQPAVSGRDAAARAKNRRVEISYPDVK